MSEFDEIKFVSLVSKADEWRMNKLSKGMKQRKVAVLVEKYSSLET